MDEFELKNQITSLIYDILKKKPNSFAKLNDNTVVVFFDLTSKLNISKANTFNGIEIKITREENNGSYHYKLNAKGVGNIYFDCFISDLDSKTAFKFFQTDLMEQKQLQNLALIRDTMLKELENANV